jgi:hypothetical protein
MHPMTEHSPDDRSAYAILRRLGLLDDVARRLARLPHCTPAYVEAHIALLRARREGLNHLVDRLRRNAPVPVSPQELERRSCSSRPK